MNKPNTIHLKGRALEVAKQLRATVERARGEAEAIQAEFQATMEHHKARSQAQLDNLWRDLLESSGLDFEDRGDYHIDASYLDDHGFAFLARREEEPEGPCLQDILPAAVARKH